MTDPADLDRAFPAIISAIVAATGTALVAWFRTGSARKKAEADADSAAVTDYRIMFSDLRAELLRARDEAGRHEREARELIDRVARLQVALETLEAAHARVETERDHLRTEVARLQAELANARHSRATGPVKTDPP